MIDIKELKRDGLAIRKALITLDDNSVVIDEDCLVYIPKRFLEGELGSQSPSSATINVSCVLGVVFPSRKVYSPITAIVRVNMEPFSIDEESIKGTDYYVLSFNKGDTFFESLYCIEDSQLGYAYYMEFNYYAKIPWYLNRDDLSSLFDNAKDETGNATGSVPQVIRVMNGVQFRDPDNLDTPYSNSKAMDEGKEPYITGLSNSAMLVDGTFSKVMGGYLQDNTVAAIVNPDTKVTDLENLIKGVPS